MKFSLTQEQEDLREVVRKFLEAKSPEAVVRDTMCTERGFDPDVWKQMADQLCLQGLIIPEDFGGQGFGFVELAVVLEEMGRALVCAPFFSTVVLAANLLLQSNDADAQAAYLPGIASGNTVATVAFTEENGRWDEEGIHASATQHGKKWRIDGRKSYVLDGLVADLILVAARTATGVSLFAVQAETAGLTKIPMSTMDQTRKQAMLEFAEVEAALVGNEGQGWPVLARMLDLAAVALAAEAVGGAQRVLEMAVDYAKSRVQFGRPIGSFQAIKHRCADVFMEVELAKSAASYASRCASEDDTELSSVACLAKAYCSDAYVYAAGENIQVHGGIGFTWEHPAHLYFRRAKSSELLFGDSIYHRDLFVERIVKSRSA